MCDLHRFFIAIAGAAVNDDGLGGSACNLLVWREIAMLPGPQDLWSGGWQDWADVNVTAEGVRIWLFSVGFFS